MARQYTRNFELEIAPLLQQEPKGVPGQQLMPGLKDFLEPHRLNQLNNQRVIPLGLRWRVGPDPGLPRMPFAVWRRDRRRGNPFDIKLTSREILRLKEAPGVFSFQNKDIYILIITIDNNGPNVLKVKALDNTSKPLLLQEVDVPANTATEIRFQHPFISGFSCKGGNFQIKSVVGVSMQHYIERDDWELIEVVGLPALDGEISGYDPEQQGFPSQLKPAPDAALDRLGIAQQFYKPLAASFPSGENMPIWEIPSPQESLLELRDGAPPLLDRVNKMFESVDNRSIPSQQDFIAKIVGKGIHQPEFPDQATEDVSIDVPLLASFLLNSSTDPWFALTSGFGTSDFPEIMKPNRRFLEPESYFDVSHDYMVSSIFRMFFKSPIEFKFEFCALSHRSPLPTSSVLGLGADLFFQNRPPERDDPYSAEVAVTWQKPEHRKIQGYAVAVTENASNGKYLNNLRSDNSVLPALFIPSNPGQTSDPLLQLQNRYMHHQAQFPILGIQQNRYGVAVMDAYARWSDWKTTQLELTPPLPQAPRLLALSLEPDLSQTNGPTVAYELIVEISWDWQDRSPKRFQLAGVFHRRIYLPDGTKDSGHIPPENYPSIFQSTTNVATGSLLEILFPSDNPQGTPPDFNALPTCSDPRVSIDLLPQALNEQGQIIEGEMRKIQVTISDMSLTFQTNEEWFFTFFIKGAEWVNQTDLSDSTLPLLPGRPPRLTSYIPNPIPPPPPIFVPATILWSTLPDARGMSRYRLAFNPVPSATGGYAIFQAFETKLRDLIGLPIRTDPDLIERASELRDQVMPDVRSLDAFGRLNTTLIPPPPQGAMVEYEVEIPGTLEGIVAFAVTSVSREQESSPLSTPWLLVGIPRRSVPAPPILSQVQQNGNTELICKFPKGPFRPEKVEVMRVRNEFPSRSINTMGPARHLSQEPAWATFDELGRPSTDEEFISQFKFSLAEQTPPSWFPYYYRAIATGKLSEQDGLIPGRSSQSNLVTIDQLPKNLPLMEDLLGDQVDSENIQMQFTGDAPVETTPHGTFKLVITVMDINQKKFLDNPVLDISLANAKEHPGTGNLIIGELYYSPVDSNGKRSYQTLLKSQAGPYVFRVRLMDPLKRITDRMLSGEIRLNENPHLRNLKVKRRDRSFRLLFESKTTVKRPPFGSYELEISLVSFRGRGTTLLEKIALHRVRIGVLRGLGQNNSKIILRERKGGPGQASKYGAFFPDVLPSSPFLRRGKMRVRLTAPDGAFVVLEQNID